MNEIECIDLLKNDKIFIIQKYLSNNDNKYYIIIQDIINKYNIEHSTNVNGIFLNISMLDDIILDKIYNEFIKYSIKENNNCKIDKIDESKNIINEIVIKNTENNYEKDTLTFDKFDKFLLQQSRINISI